MVKRINVSVPDELADKMERWKGDFNFSKIFQKAVRSEIDKKKIEAIEKKKYDKQMKEVLSMDSIVKSLKESKKRSIKRYYDLGKKEALNWLNDDPDYDCVQLILKWDVKSVHPYDLDPYTIFEEDAKEWIENDDFMDFEVDSTCWGNEYAINFFEGFKDAICEYWDEVEHLI